jgi:hypothetical protein
MPLAVLAVEAFKRSHENTIQAADNVGWSRNSFLRGLIIRILRLPLANCMKTSSSLHTSSIAGCIIFCFYRSSSYRESNKLKLVYAYGRSLIARRLDSCNSSSDCKPLLHFRVLDPGRKSGQYFTELQVQGDQGSNTGPEFHAEYLYPQQYQRPAELKVLGSCPQLAPRVLGKLK